MGKLPDNSIGISDIEDYRACPQRHAFSMRRHWPLPERLQLEPNEKDLPPEKTNWTNAYGSAIHDAIHYVETGDSHEDAINKALAEYGTYLTPEDIELLGEDLDVYERRRPLGVTLVGSEMELRIPLFVHPTEGQIYFRFRLDVLQRLIANPSVFVHRDYKSSAWRRTPAEVHKDPQLWAYNLGIHDYFPECETLLQTYDQLKFGEVQTTKNDAQRAAMRRWLIAMVNIIIADETYKPKLNDFCRFCPLVVTCREPRRAVKYTRAKIAVLAPLSKVGRKVKVEFAEEGDELERIIREDMPEMIAVRKHIEHVEKLLKTLLQEMSVEDRERLGWLLKERHTRTITSDGLRELHEYMGDAFYTLVNLPITRLEDVFGKPKKGEVVPHELQIARKWTTEDVSGTNLVPAKSGE